MTVEEYINQNFVTEVEERDILLVDKKAFGDEEEHEYHCICYDGVAYGKAEGWHDPNKENVILSYPTVGTLSQYPAKMEAIREFMGLNESDKIFYGDIAIKYGKIGKWFIDCNTLNAIDVLAKQSKMDSWLGITTEGNFKDLENGGKVLSAKSAMHDLIDGLTDKDFDTLTDNEKFLFVKFLGKLLK